MNHINITLRQLRAFRAVVETGSFTKASENLHLTQSALSGLIKEFENNMDLRLFDRTTRKLSLSAAGQQIYPMVKQILSNVESMATEVGRIKSLESGTVTVAVSQQLAAAVLPKIIAEFTNKFPNIKVAIEDCSVDQVIRSVNDGMVDFGIGPARATSDSVASELLFKQPFYVVMPPEHKFVQKETVRWSDLADETLITLSGSFSQLLAADLPETEANLISNAAYQVNFITTAFSMVNQDIGLTFCLAYSRNRVSQNGLAMRQLVEPVITRDSFLYRKRGRTLSDASQKFYAMLHQHIQNNDYS